MFAKNSKRENFCSTINKDLHKRLKKLSEVSRISKAKFTDEAIEMLLEKYSM